MERISTAFADAGSPSIGTVANPAPVCAETVVNARSETPTLVEEGPSRVARNTSDPTTAISTSNARSSGSSPTRLQRPRQGSEYRDREIAPSRQSPRTPCWKRGSREARLASRGVKPPVETPERVWRRASNPDAPRARSTMTPNPVRPR
jgi:hypothetical protein